MPKSISELGKTWSLSPTFKNPSFESVNELICPNLMFTIENKIDDLKEIRLSLF